MIRTQKGLAALVLGLALLGSGAVRAKQVVGWIENVKVYPGGTVVAAKIDTGARATSLHCDCVRAFQRNGEHWLNVKIEGVKGNVVELERKVVGVTYIKRHSGKAQERFVIKLGVCLGSVYKDVEVNVVDRAGFKFPMLIGRNFLGGRFLVDTAATHVSKPECSNVPTGQ